MKRECNVTYNLHGFSLVSKSIYIFLLDGHQLSLVFACAAEGFLTVCVLVVGRECVYVENFWNKSFCNKT